MRITGGTYARRPLETPPGGDTRPTTARVREALFSALDARGALVGARVLDLFAGSGALGLEALSRGAAEAVFVERHGPTLAVARRNARSLQAEPACRFVRADALAWLGRDPGEPFDLVLADPPYALEGLQSLPDRALKHLAPGGLLALEHGRRTDFGAHPALVTSRRYGSTLVSLFAPEGSG